MNIERVWAVWYSATGNTDKAVNTVAGELAAKEAAFADVLRSAGAHYVLHSVAELPGLVPAVEERLRQGQRPW